MLRSRCLIALGAAAVLAAAPAFAAAAPAQRGFGQQVGQCSPGLGIGLTGASASRDPRARVYVVDQVRPGARFTRRFFVCNGTSETVTVKLYPGPATVAGGRFNVSEGHTASELTSWITIRPTEVVVPSGQRRDAVADFAVPAGVAGGERYGVLLAELPPRGRPTGLSVASRVGIRVYLYVVGARAPRSDFVVDTLQAGRTSDGTPVVTAQIHNTGGRALDMRGELLLKSGPGGLSGGPFPAKLGTTLASGQTEPVTIVLDKAITGGPWTARLTLRSGLLERRAEGQLTFPDAAGASTPPVKANNVPLTKDKRVLIPVAIGLIGGLLLLLLCLWLVARRWNPRGKPAGGRN